MQTHTLTMPTHCLGQMSCPGLHLIGHLLRWAGYQAHNPTLV